MRDLAAVRAAAKQAVESMRMDVRMAESAGASADSPRRALLGDVAAADILLLLLGAHYGAPGPTGTSPTEDEFNEALRLGKPIVALVQECEREPEQDAFVGRVRGDWVDGRLTGSFTDEHDVALAAVRGLSNLAAGEGDQDDTLAAQARAETLAGSDQRQTFSSGGPRARVIIVPLGGRELLDDAALNDGTAADQLAVSARNLSLVPQELGIEGSDSSSGIALRAGQEHGQGFVQIELQRDGALVVETSVEGSGNFGFWLVSPQRLTTLVERAARIAMDTWQTIDPGGVVQKAAITIAIPNAQQTLFGEQSGNSISTGNRLPERILAPLPALVARRADLANSATVSRIMSAIERIYRDAGAVR